MAYCTISAMELLQGPTGTIPVASTGVNPNVLEQIDVPLAAPMDSHFGDLEALAADPISSIQRAGK